MKSRLKGIFPTTWLVHIRSWRWLLRRIRGHRWQARWLLQSQNEPAVEAQLRRLIRPGDICVDVGAFVGHHTILMAELVGPSGCVYAFEAHPYNYAMLLHNIAQSGLGSRIVTENLAVLDSSRALVSLHMGRSYDPSEWNIRGYDVDGHPTKAVCQVRAMALDPYFADKRPPHVVKLDVEGAEAEVLNGMAGLIQNEKPILLIEFHSEEGWAGRRLLIDAGYDLFRAQDGSTIVDASDVQRVYHCYAVPSRDRK